MLGVMSLLRAKGLAAMVVLLAFASSTRADKPLAGKPDRSASQDKPQPPSGAGFGTGAVPVAPVPRPIGCPQPNLRHATPSYQVTFAVSPAEAALIELLDDPLPEKGMPEWNESPLRDIQTWVAETYKVPVSIDARSLEDAGMDLDVPVSRDGVRSGSLGAALRATLAQVDLTVTVRHEGLEITTLDKANEQFLVGVYPLPTQVDARNAQTFVDDIQSVIAADTVGGSGAIRIADEANELVISQTLAVHVKLIAFMRTAFDADLAWEPEAAQKLVSTRVYRLRDRAMVNEITENLVSLCNTSLGETGDPDAKVSLFGDDRVVIQSASRPFHVYAAEMIRALDGVEFGDDAMPTQRSRRPVNSGRNMGGGMGLGGGSYPLCWVAREVYGTDDHRWLLFRRWMIDEAPDWLRVAYITHGEALSIWLVDRPVAKAALRPLMDAAIRKQ